MPKRLGVCSSFVVAAALLLGSTGNAAETKAAPAAKGGGGKAVLIPAGEMKWTTPPNSPPGVQLAVLWGDPAKGAFGALHKLPAGFAQPLHHHSAGYRGVVVSGTFLQAPEGEAEKSLGPGSYFQYSGKKKHVTKCAAGAECVIFMDSGGAWDMVVEGDAKAPAKK
jgi:hypothetical protein